MIFLIRLLSTYKRYTRNRRYPEGSIAEGVIAEECLTFCSRYLHGVETRLTREPRIKEGVLDYPQGARNIDWIQLREAHRYILFNSDELESFRRLVYKLFAKLPSKFSLECTSYTIILFCRTHMTILNRKHQKLSSYALDKKHNAEFIDWFKEEVCSIYSLVGYKRNILLFK